MSTVINDSRSAKGKMGGSRKRFLNRNKKHIKDAVQKSFEAGGITDSGKGGVDVVLPKRGISEPTIVHSNSGTRTRVLPGNKKFTAGDQIARPPGGQGGNQASDSGEGEDDFSFHLSEQEFYDFLFDGLELPNFEERGQQKSEETKSERAGIVSDGTPNNLDLVRSVKKRMGRNIASKNKHNERILELWTTKLTMLAEYNENAVIGFEEPDPGTTKGIEIKRVESHINQLVEEFDVAKQRDFAGFTAEIDAELAELEGKKSTVQWNELDLKYRNFDEKPVNVSKAVMFCVMDVSGSMDQETKNNAKLFYVLLHKFLEKHYDQTDVVFIRHHGYAEEVDEHEFFYGRETGGTVVSSGLEKMLEIIEERYPADQWNVYGAQASDGDNFRSDMPKCPPLLEEILEKSQGYWYTEITRGQHQDLWHAYQEVAERNPNKLWLGHIEERQDIPKVFREFFKKRGENVSTSSYAAPSVSSFAAPALAYGGS